MKLYRYAASDQGTFGVLVFGSQFIYTGELPWRGNAPYWSCIPEGKYTVRLRSSPKYGNVYEVTNVEGRTYILMHQGNYCGDSRLGFKTNVQGCILLGLKTGRLNGQKVVLDSRTARRRLESYMKFETFELEIINGMV